MSDVKLTEKDLMEMDLHQVETFNNVCAVTRVLGGWIYENWHSPQQVATSTFVPVPKHLEDKVI